MPGAAAASLAPPPNVLAEHIDAKAFPLLREYLSKLPSGMRSYAGCQCIADYAIRLQREYKTVWPTLPLPEPMLQTITQPWTDGEFIPIVSVTCQSLILRQHLRLDEAGYLKHSLARTSSVLDNPVYRVLLAVMSPNLLLNNLQGRWGKFVRGVALLNLGGARGHHTLKMVAPAGLHTPMWVDFYCKTFTDLLKGSRAKDVSVKALAESATDTLFELHWR